MRVEAGQRRETGAGRGALLECQGLFKAHPRSGWKPGRLSLTRDRLRFTQNSRMVWEVSVAQIDRARREPAQIDRARRELLARRETIRLFFHKDEGGARVSSVWMVPRDMGIWLRHLAGLCFDGPAEACAVVLPRLSREGAAVLQCLCDRWQASAEEVACHAGVRDSEEVLRLVHREINPAASQEVGFPLLASQPEQKHGADIRWLISLEWPETEDEYVEGTRDFECDVFDEADRYCVVADLPGVSEEDVMVEALEDCLLISAVAGSCVYRKKIPLPSHEVDRQSLRTGLHNHILEIQFRKRVAAAKL